MITVIWKASFSAKGKQYVTQQKFSGETLDEILGNIRLFTQAKTSQGYQLVENEITSMEVCHALPESSCQGDRTQAGMEV